jgi:hypothetical protein
VKAEQRRGRLQHSSPPYVEFISVAVQLECCAMYPVYIQFIKIGSRIVAIVR